MATKCAWTVLIKLEAFHKDTNIKSGINIIISFGESE